MIAPGMPPPPQLDTWEDGNNNNPETLAAVWRERERRQRTIRLLMMFLVMLLLMDGEEGAQRRQQNALRKRKQKDASRLQKLEADVFKSRQVQEENIRGLVKNHPRYLELYKKNGNEDVEAHVIQWAEEHADEEKDQFAENAVRENRMQPEFDPADNRKVFHYPWNATGFYRGEWLLHQTDTQSPQQRGSEKPSHIPVERSRITQFEVVDATSLEGRMLHSLRQLHEPLRVMILPDNVAIEMRDDNNLTSLKWETLRTDSNNVIVRTDPNEISQMQGSNQQPESITLTHDSGRAAFQFFSRAILSMKELSLVDGFVKIYDSTSPGYSTRKDILLRVRGILIHSIGRLSLVSNVDVSRTALVIDSKEMSRTRRRLQEALLRVESANINEIRDDAISLFSEKNLGGQDAWAMHSPEFDSQKQQNRDTFNAEYVEQKGQVDDEEPVTANRTGNGFEAVGPADALENKAQSHVFRRTEATNEGLLDKNQISQRPGETTVPAWSDVVLPYPFVRDDRKETVRRIKTPAARLMPPREQALEDNAAGCGFEINLDVGEVEWTVGGWRKLVGQRIADRKRLDPSAQPGDDEDAEKDEPARNLRGSWVKQTQDQALVMTLVGTIHSPNCDFTATVNATALRTDWEATTSRAINYSFVMMLVCLTQILVLLRQLLHSQGQSAAARVSLLCIGWQTMLDALLCLAHIYMSLSIQPLFSAFASVSFFKLLIFCVIEMKYMAIIIQARNSSNGGQTTEILRRQIALLHIRFYSAMAASFLMLFYVGEKYRVFYILALYSFWVPQIILNVITEAKMPMHTYYIYGMSVTRLVAPLYMLGIRNNFLREVYPEAPYDIFACEMLVLWVSLQTAILIGQTKYGARFMIPARFLPPKFDYSRPIPPSMLPPGIQEVPTLESMEDRDDTLRSSVVCDRQSLVVSSESPRGRHTTAVTTRNRMRGNRSAVRNENGIMTSEQHAGTTSVNGNGALNCTSTAATLSTSVHTLDCSICYDTIDIRKRHDYMLAPCNHLFHRECLVQWMDVKMECPICRTELPAL